MNGQVKTQEPSGCVQNAKAPTGTEKECIRCLKSKPVSEFYARHRNGDKPGSECKDCIKSRITKWNLENNEHRREYLKKWRLEHLSICKAYSKKRWAENKDDLSVKVAKWNRENPDKKKAHRRKAEAKMISTPQGHLTKNIRRAICHSLREGSKAKRRWEVLVGYGVEQLKQHLEKQFIPGMTWENYGTIWEIDHIIPQSVFNFAIPEDMDFKRCWDLKNLRPLWSGVNRAKKDILNKPFQPSLALAI